MRTSHSGATEAGPPRMPEIERRVHPRHVRDLAILALLPLLALLGLAGPREHEQVRRTPALEVLVDHPGLSRSSRHATLRITTTNLAPEPLDSIWIALPAEYLAGFTVGAVVPQPDVAHRILLADLGPGESRAVEVELGVRRAGVLRGSIGVGGVAGDSLKIPLRTIILP
jgi:hypothetical protein